MTWETDFKLSIREAL